MSYNISDINKLKSQIKQYYSFIKNDGMILTNFAKYLLSKTDMNLEQAIINLKDMSIKDIQTKLYELTLELNTLTEISDIIKNKIYEENKKLEDVYSKVVEYKNLHKDLHKKYKKLEEECKSLEDTLEDTIDGIYKNKIYDNEYTFEESKYIIKKPMIHLDVDKVLDDIKNKCCKINSITHKELIRNYNGTNSDDYRVDIKGTIKINFPINIKLNDNENIIKIYYICKNEDINIDMNTNYKYMYNLIYITNYGRIIKTNIIEFFLDPSHSFGINPHRETISNPFSVIQNNNYYKCNLKSIRVEQIVPLHHIALNINKQTIDLIEQSQLNYRIPRLFIDVIDAFHTQNTDLMQECCKKYLEISRESKIKDSILKDPELNNKLKEKDDIIKSKDLELEEINKLKEKDDIIKSKDLELEDKNKVIESQLEEINKLKDEFTKFKQSLSMLINK